MDIDTAIKRLKSLGLYVERHVPGAMTDRSPSDGLTIAHALVPQDGLHHLDDACFIFPIRDGWCYRNWNGIGGRAADDVHLENLPLETAIQYAESFYFGAPLILDGWAFPVNRHPEWDVERLHAAYDCAPRLSHSAWRTLRHQRYVTSKGRDEYERFLTKFREIAPVQPREDLRLWMRNDLDEMYFVEPT